MKAQILVLAIFILGSSDAVAQQQNPIRIGAILHLTGTYAMQGAAFREGIELAADQINQAGGLLGHPVEVLIENSSYDGKTVSTAAQKLIKVNRVTAAIISTYHEAKSGGAQFENAKIPLMVLWDSTPELDAMGEFIFSLGPWLPSTGETSADYASEQLGAKTAVVLSNNNNWSLMVGEVFAERFQRKGGTLAHAFALNPEHSDFRTVITRTKSFKPDVIYAPLTDHLLAFFKQARQLGVQAPIITSDNLTEELIRQSGGVLEGVYQSQVADPGFGETKEMTAKYRKKFGKEPAMILFTAWGYDALQLLVRAISVSGVNGENIAQKLYQTRDFPGASGKISFSPGGSSPRPVQMFQIKGRGFVAQAVS